MVLCDTLKNGKLALKRGLPVSLLSPARFSLILALVGQIVVLMPRWAMPPVKRLRMNLLNRAVLERGQVRQWAALWEQRLPPRVASEAPVSIWAMASLLPR